MACVALLPPASASCGCLPADWGVLSPIRISATSDIMNSTVSETLLQKGGAIERRSCADREPASTGGSGERTAAGLTVIRVIRGPDDRDDGGWDGGWLVRFRPGSEQTRQHRWRGGQPPDRFNVTRGVFGESDPQKAESRTLSQCVIKCWDRHWVTTHSPNLQLAS